MNNLQLPLLPSNERALRNARGKSHLRSASPVSRHSIPAMKVRLMFSVAALLMCAAVVARGQLGLDGFNPNANGQVFVVVAQPDGKILVGGEFTAISGVPRNHIARLNSDGTVDAVFDPNADGDVLSIAVQPDWKGYCRRLLS